MRKFKVVMLLTAASLLHGCSTGYKCPLGHECSDAHDAYRAAVVGGGNKETTMPNYNKRGVPFDDGARNTNRTRADAGRHRNRHGSGGAANKPTQGFQSFEPYAGGAMTERPIYQPTRPLRIWIAPWQARLDSETQADPVLMSGQFMYATIPGYWSMGVMRDDGTLGSVIMLEPSNPSTGQQNPSGRVQPRQTVIDVPGQTQ